MRFDRDIYHYGSMREYKHRNALKDAEWPTYTPLMQKIENASYFIILFLLILAVLFLID
jgi:hypothetical protein